MPATSLVWVPTEAKKINTLSWELCDYGVLFYSMNNKKQVIVIGGPTAVGKTAAAIQLAKHLGTEIISADSRQCYKELKIGVARPSDEELQEVPHYFIA